MKFNYRFFCFYFLNLVRLISVVSLLLVFSSSIFVIVTDVRAVNAFLGGHTDQSMIDCDYIQGSDVPNQAAGVFWAVVNRLLIVFEAVTLLLSEVGWPMKFFDRFFPVLGTTFGLGALGVFQTLIGASVLSHHCDDFTLVSAFFLFCIGCVNILCGLIWHENAKDKRSITSWREDSKGVLPTHSTGSSTFRASLFINRKASSPLAGEKGYGFGRQGEKSASLKGFKLAQPPESLPRYSPAPAGRLTRTQESPAPRPTSLGSLVSEVRDEPEVQKTPVFRSSPTAF